MRKNKQQAKEAREAMERQAQTKKWLTDQSQRAIKLRSKEREFHGLEREFIDYQNELIAGYEKSKNIKHPRDVGTVREELLRRFLIDTGLLPKRYAVSERSIRVASTTGHVSNEIDIALYDPLDSITLMQQSNIYEVLPLESVYGVIQIKSKLTKTEIESGLSNIVSFKKLQRLKRQATGVFNSNPLISDTGFGLLFAYDSDMEWLDIVKELENFADKHPSKQLANAVFILKKGFFMYGQDGAGPLFRNNEIAKITKNELHGRPDNEGLCLWNFYFMLLELLRGTSVAEASPMPYFRLPQVSGVHSYQFMLGYHAELANCSKNAKHGDYQRKVSPEQLEKVIEWCKLASMVDINAAEDQIYKRPPGLPQPKGNQQHYVHLYNPDNLPLKDILTIPQTLGGKPVIGIGYDIILSSQMEIYIPYFYSIRDGIISDCPKCLKDARAVPGALATNDDPPTDNEAPENNEPPET